MQNKNKLDSFLDFYEKKGKEVKKLKKIYYKPSFVKCMFGFMSSLLFFLLLLFVFCFQFHFMYLLLFFGNGLILIYYGINLFRNVVFIYLSM